MKTLHKTRRKFLVNDADLRGVDLKLLDTELIYLDSKDVKKFQSFVEDRSTNLLDDTEIVLSKVTHNGKIEYWSEIKYDSRGFKDSKIDFEITEKVYEDILKNFTTSKIVKKKFIFNYLRHAFELDLYIEKDIMILSIEPKQEKSLFPIPPFVSVIKEITEDPNYKILNLVKSGD